MCCSTAALLLQEVGHLPLQAQAGMTVGMLHPWPDRVHFIGEPTCDPVTRLQPENSSIRAATPAMVGAGTGGLLGLSSLSTLCGGSVSLRGPYSEKL